VFSRQEGATPVGRKMRHSASQGGSPRVSDYSTDSVLGHLDAIPLSEPLRHGTVIEWNDVRAFPQDPDQDAQNSWLDATLRNVAAGLGTRHHRLLGDRGPSVVVDTYDQDVGE